MIVQPVAMGLKVLQFSLCARTPFGSQAFGDGFKFSNHFDRSSSFKLFEQRLDPLVRHLRIVRMQRMSHRSQMLAGMIKIQPLRGRAKTVCHQVPNPHRPVGHD